MFEQNIDYFKSKPVNVSKINDNSRSKSCQLCIYYEIRDCKTPGFSNLDLKNELSENIHKLKQLTKFE